MTETKITIYSNYKHSLQLQVVGFHSLMCFLKSSILSMFLILFGTVFHIRLPLKQSACVPYLEVMVSGNFSNCLLRRSYQVFFKSKKFFMIGGLKSFIGLYISINNVFYFHECSTIYLLIVDLRNSHLAFHILSEGYVCVLCLFDCLKFYYRTSRSKGSI